MSEFATDLKEIYPEKEVTLLHSRPQLMPIYPIEVHVAGKLHNSFSWSRKLTGSNDDA
jgi:hypothetical protein